MPIAHRMPIAHKMKSESADKPGSVVDNHSSWAHVAINLMQPTRTQCEQHRWVPIWPCSRWGLPCHGMLPPMRCALTTPFHPYHLGFTQKGGLFSAALSVDSRPPGVTWHLALWSPDFPLFSSYQVREKQRLPGRLTSKL
jgi:hypothetical protein